MQHQVLAYCPIIVTNLKYQCSPVSGTPDTTPTPMKQNDMATARVMVAPPHISCAAEL